LSNKEIAMFKPSGNPRALSALAGVSLAFVFSVAAVAAATGAEEGPPADLTKGSEKGPPANLPSAPVGVPAPQAVSNWSPFTSEESPPLTASNGQLISAMQCTGSYCDNVALGYENLPGVNHTWNGWTSYFSEEGPPGANRIVCGGNNSFMTGISCQGSYCDNVSIQCTAVTGKTRTLCVWQPWFSEEARYSILPQGVYAGGLACRGSYCDDFSILACETR
jgi:hypothetical protein